MKKHFGLRCRSECCFITPRGATRLSSSWAPVLLSIFSPRFAKGKRMNEIVDFQSASAAFYPILASPQNWSAHRIDAPFCSQTGGVRLSTHSTKTFLGAISFFPPPTRMGALMLIHARRRLLLSFAPASARFTSQLSPERSFTTSTTPIFTCYGNSAMRFSTAQNSSHSTATAKPKRFSEPVPLPRLLLRSRRTSSVDL